MEKCPISIGEIKQTIIEKMNSLNKYTIDDLSNLIIEYDGYDELNYTYLKLIKQEKELDEFLIKYNELKYTLSVEQKKDLLKDINNNKININFELTKPIKHLKQFLQDFIKINIYGKDEDFKKEVNDFFLKYNNNFYNYNNIKIPSNFGNIDFQFSNLTRDFSLELNNTYYIFKNNEKDENLTIIKEKIKFLNCFYKVIYGDWGWGLGIGDWGLGIGPNPQSPIPNPQSPIPNILKKYIKFLINNILFFEFYN